MGIAAVNISCGYYKEHHLDHYVIAEEMLTNIEKAKEIIKAEVSKPFAYKEIAYLSGSGLPYGGRDGYGDYGYYYSGYGDYGIAYNDMYDQLCDEYEIIWEDALNGWLGRDSYWCASGFEALGKFMMNHPDVKYKDVVSVSYYGDDCGGYMVDMEYAEGELKGTAGYME